MDDRKCDIKGEKGHRPMDEIDAGTNIGRAADVLSHTYAQLAAFLVMLDEQLSGRDFISVRNTIAQSPARRVIRIDNPEHWFPTQFFRTYAPYEKDVRAVLVLEIHLRPESLDEPVVVAAALWLSTPRGLSRTRDITAGDDPDWKAWLWPLGIDVPRARMDSIDIPEPVLRDAFPTAEKGRALARPLAQLTNDNVVTELVDPAVALLDGESE